MPGRATLLLLLTGQTLFFAAIGLGLWVISGRPPQSFVTFGIDQLANGALLAGVLVAVAAAGGPVQGPRGFDNNKGRQGICAPVQPWPLRPGNRWK